MSSCENTGKSPRINSFNEMYQELIPALLCHEHDEANPEKLNEKYTTNSTKGSPTCNNEKELIDKENESKYEMYSPMAISEEQ
ncbi:Hypothetical predicted protein [Octopus vulgaris]|uniref:Uncharacterized protein n=1 Tax=Octopus vulgaris TaxID=6645 RepID=A0AA36F8V6_OCTVU|nr:Hypothetical predicted protein [Octopus vulgaris]